MTANILCSTVVVNIKYKTLLIAAIIVWDNALSECSSQYVCATVQQIYFLFNNFSSYMVREELARVLTLIEFFFIVYGVIPVCYSLMVML